MRACRRRPPLLARCPLTLHLWRRADRNPATLPDDSASVPALQSIDRLLCSSQSMAQLLRCSLVVLLLSQGFKAAHFRKTEIEVVSDLNDSTNVAAVSPFHVGDGKAVIAPKFESLRCAHNI